MDIETLVARGLQILLALGGAYLIALWFVLAVWTFRDIETRSRSVITQVFSTLLVVLFWVPGLLLYRLLRPAETLDESYQRSLEEEYLIQDLEELPLCPSCNHFVEDDFQICPHCNTQLREPCGACSRLIDLRWDVCPYCGTQHHRHGPAIKAPAAASKDDDRWVDPSVIERRLRENESQRIREETRALPAATAATTLGRHLFRAPDREDPSVADGVPVSPERGERLNGQSLVRGPSENAAGNDGASTARDVEQSSPVSPRIDTGPDVSGLADGDGEEERPDDTDSTKVPDRYRVT